MNIEAGTEVVELLVMKAAEDGTPIFGEESSISFGLEIRFEEHLTVGCHPSQRWRGIG